MSTPSTQELTQLLVAWSNGDQAALDRLIPFVLAELRELARRYMKRERPGHTLQTTALVNEAYLRLIDQRHVRWQNRAHFFAVSALLMRRILVDHARHHHYAKRGGGEHPVSLDEAAAVSPQQGADLLALDEALTALATLDPQQSRIVELRFFGGLTIKETAEVIGISPATVKRDWNVAKLWLYKEISRR